MKYLEINKTLIIIILTIIALQSCSLLPSNNNSQMMSTTTATSNVFPTPSNVSVTQSPVPPTQLLSSITPTITPTAPLGVPTETVTPTKFIPAPGPPHSGWLVINSYGGFPDAIDLIHANGMGWRNIFGDFETHPHNPFWSPDGQWIAFTMARDDELGSDIYLMRPDGSDQQRITNSVGSKRARSWSPDGKSIIYSQTVGDGLEAEVDIFVVDVESWIVSQITNTPGVYEHSPVYSPNGETIAFTSVTDNDTNNWYLMFMNRDGSNPRRVMETPIGGGKLAWSPNGDQIVSSSSDECKDLYVVSSDGSELRQLTNAPGSEISPSWSPDGSWIAFMGSEACASGGAIIWEIFLIRPDGSDLVQVTNNPQRHPVDPAWSPLPDLRSGERFTITESGNNLNLRESPSLDGTVLVKLVKGEEIIILEGPVEVDDYLWWYVQALSSNTKGWVAENPGWFAGN